MDNNSNHANQPANHANQGPSVRYFGYEAPEVVWSAASAVLRALGRHGALTKKEIKNYISGKYRVSVVLTPALELLLEHETIEKEGAKYLINMW